VQWDLRTQAIPGTFDLVVVAGVLEYFNRRSSLRDARDRLVDGVRPGGRLFVVTTRSPGAEDSWWSRALPRGSRINEYVARHPALSSLATEQASWYVIHLFRKRA